MALGFGLALGNAKSWARNNDYLQALDPDWVVLDSRSFTPDDARRWMDRLVGLGLSGLIDPVNYFDQSPLNNGRPAFYKRLPYASGAQITTGGSGRLTNDARRRSYAKPIIGYQRARNVRTLIAPYFYADHTDSSLIEESLRLGQLTTQASEASSEPLEVWTGLAIAENWLRDPNRQVLLQCLRDFPAETLYLLVRTTQGSAQPLGDLEVLKGLQQLIDFQHAADHKLIVGRRYSSGLLLGALGVDGWTTGYEGERQNFSPPPLSASATGGRARDWWYSPKLLNSLLLTTRNGLISGQQGTFAPGDPYERQLFAVSGTPASLTTAQRRLLHRHNIYALRQQSHLLAGQTATAKKATMGSWIAGASADYAAVGWAWDASEAPGFLANWLTLV